MTWWQFILLVIVFSGLCIFIAAPALMQLYETYSKIYIGAESIHENAPAPPSKPLYDYDGPSE